VSIDRRGTMKKKLVRMNRVGDRAGTWSLTRRTYADGTVVEVLRGGPPAHARPCLDAFSAGYTGYNTEKIGFAVALRKFQREIAGRIERR
jgi:hypothetical protein